MFAAQAEGLHPQHPCKNSGTVVVAYNPHAGVVKTGDFLELTVHLVLVSSRFSENPRLKNQGRLSTHSSKGRLHKIKPVKIPTWLRIGLLRSQELLTIAGCCGGSQFSLGGCPCSQPDALIPSHIWSVLIGHSECPRFFA